MSITTYSTAEVAASMGCTERWLIDQLRASRFPGRKIGRHWRMTEQDVTDALDTCANAMKPTPAVSAINIGPARGLTRTSRRRMGGL